MSSTPQRQSLPSGISHLIERFGRTVSVGVVMVAALLGIASSAAAGPRVREGNLRLRVDVFSAGVSLAHGLSRWDGISAPGNDSEFNANTTWVHSSLLRLGVEKGRLRVSTTVYEQPMGWFMESYLPITVGYTIWQRPVGLIWRVQGTLPEVAGELTVGWWNRGDDQWSPVPIAARADLVAGADVLGIGLSLSAGLIYIVARDGHDTGTGWQTHSGISPNLELRLRFPTLALDLTRYPR